MDLISNTHKRLLWCLVGGVAFLLVALMVIGSFWDYQIAHAFTAPHRGVAYFAFGMTFEVLGFVTAIMVNVSLFAALSVFVKRKWLKILFHVLTAMTLIGAVYAGVFWTLSNHGFGVRSFIAAPISTAIGVALSFPTIMLFKRLNNVKLRRIIYILAIGAVLGSIANSVSGVMQLFWGRYRFFEVYENGLPFTQWFQPFGRSSAAEGHGATSFPSLHATSVVSTITLVLAGWALMVKRPTAIVFAVTTAILLVCVPVSRMVLGWHYLTDVTFSLIIGLVAFVIAVLVIDKAFGSKFKNFINKDEEVANGSEE